MRYRIKKKYCEDEKNQYWNDTYGWHHMEIATLYTEEEAKNLFLIPYEELEEVQDE